ncbi:MAG: phage shock protein operon transcriptional activator [Pontibacterium sp.]
MTPTQSLIGESALMLDLTDHIARAASLERPILILGERGTGKELVAARLHYLSQRWDKPLVSINCAAMNEQLLESELFGHEAGAFTGAAKRRMGRFERAEQGTLFLDELGTCSVTVQEKLLRVVEYGEYERLGGQTALQANVRLIAATNADLPAMADKGSFRADLLDRLAFDVIHVPPLRYREGDIELLANHYAQKMCLEMGYDYFPGFAPKALEQLNQHPWPGNVRELKNVVERAIYQAKSADEPVEEVQLDPFRAPWRPFKNSREEPSTPSLVPDSKKATPAQTQSNNANSTEAQANKVRPAEVSAIDAHNALDTANTIDLRETTSLSQKMLTQERQIIIQTLQKYYWNQKISADKLGLSYHQLRGLLKKHDMLPLKAFKSQLNNTKIQQRLRKPRR